MSEPYGLLVIGGGPAGLAAARGFRVAGGAGAVAIVADEARMPYDRPPLTKALLRGESTEAELPLEDEAWLGEHDVALVAGRAVDLDPDARRVTLSGGRTLGYRQCAITTGAEPVRPPVPGADDPGVRTVRGLDDLRELLARLHPGDPVAVVGSGFIGCEIAASLALRGHPVSLISAEALPNEQRLGEVAGRRIAGWLSEYGVETLFGAPLERVERRGGGLELVAGSHRRHAGTVVMAVGVGPRGELAAGAGLSLHEGSIPVDAAMRTERDGLLAAGDVAFARNLAAGRRLRVEHWGDALAQGEIAGRTAAGADARWNAVPGFWSTIGTHTLKYVAWGDGYDVLASEPRPGASLAVWYGREGRVVGVLAHDADDAYGQGRERIRDGAPWPF
jgi:3-phenylpropionate/trans-cinnamate dioxygenase ferredoxin reductase subunit